MIVRSRASLAAIFGLATSLVMPVPHSGLAAQTSAATDFTGDWTGSFAKTDWTFEFKRSGNIWSGRYISARNNKWQSLKGVTVAGDKVTFSLDSQPIVTFVLMINAGRSALTGNVDFHGVKLPFAAIRKS